MKIYDKNGNILYECTDPSEIKALCESIGNNLSQNYYTNSQVMSLIASSRAVYQVATLPSNPSRNTIYYVGSTAPYNVKLIDSNGTVVDLGSSSVDLTDYLKYSDITTTINDTSTNLQVPGAKAVYDSFAPISTSKYVSTFKSPNDCIVPFGFDRVLNMANERATIEGLFVSQMTDPVDGSSSLFGDLKVRQQCYGGSTAGSATNICIEQTFETYLRGSPTQRKVFFRRGYLANSATDIDINNVEAIKNSLTWKNWYPLEYPQVTLTKAETATMVTYFTCRCYVSGSTLHINIRHITTNTDLARNSSQNVSTCPLMKFKKTSEENFGTLYALSATETAQAGIQFGNDGTVALFGFKADVRYLGCFSLPLGY